MVAGAEPGALHKERGAVGLKTKTGWGYALPREKPLEGCRHHDCVAGGVEAGQPGKALDANRFRRDWAGGATGARPVSKPSAMVNLLQAFVAIVLGNVVYFVLAPSLPPAARHSALRLDLGILVDFWFCLVAYGLIRTARRWR